MTHYLRFVPTNHDNVSRESNIEVHNMVQKQLPMIANEMFCHAIYTTWHVVNRSYKKHLTDLSLTYPQYITLTLLWEQDDRTVSDIASRLCMKTSTVTPMLKRLETNGYITRNKNKRDERQIIISLSETGRALQIQAKSITACMIEETGLGYAELNQLMEKLQKLRAGLKNSNKL